MKCKVASLLERKIEHKCKFAREHMNVQIAGTTLIYLAVIYPLRNDSLLAVCQTGSGELKTKPTQMSVRELRGLGLAPDLVSSHLKLFDNAHLD